MKALTFSVLRQLSSSEFSSGEAIARQLGISRGSVWQALQDLDQYGIQVFRLPGRGYRLAEAVHWLNRDEILAALGCKARLIQLEVVETADSSNRILMQKAALGAEHGSCLAVELQTQGRGRRGRTWHTSLGGSLTFSLLWRFNQGASALSGLSLAVGVAIMRALEQTGIRDTRLKWPNDVLHDEQKLAGILIELQGDMLGPSAAVIGIGLNLKLSGQTRAHIDQAATDIAAIKSGLPDRNHLLALILNHLSDVLLQFENEGFGRLREEWSRHHFYQNRPVCMLLPDGSEYHGTVTGVAEDGALLVRGANGERRFTAGEISMRSGA
ncbi:MAG: biotin--[acetyl-CoA-carboxylase] ligase [Sulfuricella denitrificans]|nr:biotin--[acetyl-CoA-carboxylase] ligase [Sulfuricella denitrificans]